MICYPIGIQTFEKIRKGHYLYVDKTKCVYDLANSLSYVFLSRPRRFGKSLLVSTFDSYFRGKKELFSGLDIEALEQDWTEYPVLHFDLSDIKLGTTEQFEININATLASMEENYGVTTFTDRDISTRFRLLVENIYKKTGKQVVVLIDEYDSPLLTVLHDPERLDAMRTALQSFFSPLKKLDPYLRFVFITGITKFSQLSIFSQLNNLSNITMLPQYSTIVGFTQEELEKNFKDGIQSIAEQNNITYQEVLEKLKNLYDGYHFSRNSEGVYNPFSVLRAMSTKQLDNFWFETGTPTYLIKTLQSHDTFIPGLEDCKAFSSDFDVPTEAMVSALPLLYQSGYLTIKDYNPYTTEYTLGFPNTEVKVGLLHSLIPYYISKENTKTSSALGNMWLALMHDDLDGMLHTARSFFASIPYQEGTLKDMKTSEGHFTAMLYVMFSLLSNFCYSQVRTAEGRMDILLKTPTTIYVMELKMDGSVDDALAQIDDKGCLIPYESDGRRLIKAGISFSSKERTIKEWKIVEG
jgi:hypothetical protein